MEIVILGLAAWRIFQLLAFDDILDQPRRYITRLGEQWEKEGDVVPREYREKWALFLTCPYCLGFWLWAAWLIAWWIDDRTVYPALFFGGHGLVIAAHKLLSSE